MNRWEVLVVDDSARFPLHVWRYITGCLGYGIGDVGLDGVQVRDLATGWINDREPLVSEDGFHQLWWVRADGEAVDNLRKIFRDFRPQSRVCALVDVHGKHGSGYRAKNVVAFIQKEAKRFLENKVHSVSAYYSADKIDEPVLPKSRETLRRILQEIGIKRTPAKAPSDVRHVLITGAGFEIRGDRGGFGMPQTREILLEMGSPLDPEELGLHAEDKEVFPVPTRGIWNGFGVVQPLRNLAREKKLDTYWDYLLEQELRQNLGGTLHQFTPEERDKSKDEALWHERCWREAFRRSLLRHDWGYMNQSLDAAQLPLHAWLTTNYTRFADRAISLFDDDQDLGMWRIISTAAEARTLSRHGISVPGVDKPGDRYLFKLHGDISHLQTMAIAGHDKDRFTPLTMPVDDLYEIYAAAERFLIDSLQLVKPKLVIWHIVGHGLQDRRLCSLLSWVHSHVPVGTSQIFVVSGPAPKGACECLKKRLEEVRLGSSQMVHGCKLKAAEYMACLLQQLRGNDGEFPELQRAEHVLGWVKAVARRRSRNGGRDRSRVRRRKITIA